jgi:cytochrome c oxidase cbb3-type subunit III
MSINNPSESPESGDIREHAYDGIQEYDNPMPGWWVWLFYICIIFAPIYMLGVHVFDFIPTYEEDLASGQAEIAEMRATHEEANPAPTIDAAALEAYIGDVDQIAAGSATFSTRCAVCHGDVAQGLIGPNLTDEYWIHGRDAEAVFGIITDGVIEKGMTPWSGILAPEERAQLVAFIRSLEGSEPAGAKAPEGEIVEIG